MHIGPAAWNMFLAKAKHIPVVPTFKQHLKTELFH